MTEKQRNFIQRIIEEDNITGKFDQRSIPVFHQNQMVIYILAMLRLFV